MVFVKSKVMIYIIDLIYKAIAMAYSMLYVSFISQIINSFPNKKLLGYGYFQQIKNILTQMILSILMVMIVYAVGFLPLNNLFGLMLQIFIGIIVYISGSIIFHIDSFEYLISTIKKTDNKKEGRVIMKKILLLGGSVQQIIAIETAKRLGYYTVLCDYLTDNPGQYVANKFHLVSTTDKDAVLEVAKKEQIDGILAYASDPAAPTAAYVAEKMKLPGSPYRSVDILCNKDKFRSLLSENGFCTPKAKGYDDIEVAENDLKNSFFSFPVIVKPVDSSGSKGVSRIDDSFEIRNKLEYAMSFSRGHKIIVEEFVEKFGYQIAGDGLSIDGKLVFRCFANDHFDPNCENPFIPISASFPYNMPDNVQLKIHNEIQRLLTLLDMGTTTYNFDIRIDKNYNVYLMEVAPRDGGNYIPDIIRYCTGIDLVECSVKAAMGESLTNIQMRPYDGFYAYYAVHSYANGILESINIDKAAKQMIIENHINVKPGDRITTFTGANTTLGILLMKFESMNQMLDMMDHSENWISVKVV